MVDLLYQIIDLLSFGKNLYYDAPITPQVFLRTYSSLFILFLQNLIGKITSHDIIDKDSGEVLSDANSEITEELLAKFRGVASAMEWAYRRGRYRREISPFMKDVP